MAKKKLKVEVELETAKAKRQAKELEQSGSGASVATSAPKAADKLDKLTDSLSKSSKQVKDFGDNAKLSSGKISNIVRSFAGIGVGMALSYASSNMKYGGKRDAVEYIGNTVAGAGAGAATGAALGPPGAIVGAIVGGIGGFFKTFFDKSSAKEKTLEDFEKSEKIYAGAKAKQERLEELTDVKPFKYGESLEGLRQNLSNFEESVNEFVKGIRDELKKSSPDYDRIEDLKRNLSYSRGMVDQYKKAIKNIKKFQESVTENRASLSATDSLQKIGLTGADKVFGAVATEAVAGRGGAPRTGSFGFSVPTKAFSEMKFFQQPRSDWSEKATSEQLQRINGDQLKVLEKIEQKLGCMQGGSTWA